MQTFSINTFKQPFVISAEQSFSLQQGVDDERRVPRSFQTLSDDELRHVPRRRSFPGGRSGADEMRFESAPLRRRHGRMELQVW